MSQIVTLSNIVTQNNSEFNMLPTDTSIHNYRVDPESSSTSSATETSVHTGLLVGGWNIFV